MAALKLQEGERVEVVSSHGRIIAPVTSDVDIKPGTLAMSHCWGKLTEHGVVGANVNQLINNAENFSVNTGMPVMSAIAVKINRFGDNFDS